MKKLINRLMAKLGYVPAPLFAAIDPVANASTEQLIAAAPSILDASAKRFAEDPFAPTFEVEPGADALHIKLYPRPGSVQYLVSAVGPRSPAIKFEALRPSYVQVSAVVESVQ